MKKKCRRRVYACVGLVAFGAFMTIAVAWLSALFVTLQYRHTTPGMNIDGDGTWHWATSVQSGFGGAFVYSERYRLPNHVITPRPDARSAAKETPRIGGIFTETEDFRKFTMEHRWVEARGFPFFALWCEYVHGDDSSPTMDVMGGIRTGRANEVRFYADVPDVLPYWIMPIGFALDTAFYAFLLGAPLLGIPWLRRSIRRRRGHCPKCNYNLKGLGDSRCPECGWLHRENRLSERTVEFHAMSTHHDENALRKKPFCLRCSYPLHGLNCPECGRSFTETDEGIVYSSEPVSNLNRVLLSAPSYVVFALAVALFLFFTSVFSAPTLSPARAIAIVCWIIFILYLVMRWTAYRKLQERQQRVQSLSKRTRLKWLIPISIVLLTPVVVLSRTTNHLRLWMSSSSLMTYVESSQQLVPGTSRNTNTWVGLYWVQSIESRGDTVYFVLDRDGWGEGRGIVYCPHGPPDDENSYSTLGSSWYEWIAYH